MYFYIHQCACIELGRICYFWNILAKILTFSTQYLLNQCLNFYLFNFDIFPSPSCWLQRVSSFLTVQIGWAPITSDHWKRSLLYLGAIFFLAWHCSLTFIFTSLWTLLTLLPPFHSTPSTFPYVSLSLTCSLKIIAVRVIIRQSILERLCFTLEDFLKLFLFTSISDKYSIII